MDTRSSSNNQSEASSWCTIESDPGVFTELISEIGVKDVQVEELYAMDLAFIDTLKPVYGLIFLFKWRAGEKDDRPPCTDDNGIFFANQVIPNACATQAILSILLNCPDIDIGEELNNFKKFTQDFPPELKGLAISNSEVIRKTHNSFSRPEPFILTDDKRQMDEEEDIYHFISYIPFKGHLYELDGLKAGPIRLCECTNENWIEKVFPVVQQRIEKYSRSEIRFNLMAIIKSRKKVLQEQIEKKQKQKETASPENAKKIDHEILELQREIEKQEEKFKNWEIENIRRRHNYIPFLVNLLKILAEKGKLGELVQNSKKY